MEKRFDVLEEKLDKLVSVQTEIRVDIKAIQKDVEHHIQRSDNLEKLVEQNRISTKRCTSEIQSDVGLMNKRIEALEIPAKARAYLQRRWKFWATMLGSLATVLAIFRFLDII